MKEYKKRVRLRNPEDRGREVAPTMTVSGRTETRQSESRVENRDWTVKMW